MVDLLTTSEGICQTRRELFGQLFEELIRQEMINCKVMRMLVFWAHFKGKTASNQKVVERSELSPPAQLN